MKVRTAAIKCVEYWLQECAADYDGLFGGTKVVEGGPLFAKKQIGMETFRSSQSSSRAVSTVADTTVSQ